MIPATLVTIIHNEEARIGGFLCYHAPLVFETIVIDQSSTDGTRDVLKCLMPQLPNVRYFRHEHYGTPEASRPISIAYASKDWILLLDADELLDPRAPDELTKTMHYVSFIPLLRVSLHGGKEVERLYNNRLFRKSVADVPEYSNVGKYAHSQIIPKPEVKVYEFPRPAIWHFKTIEEQRLDTDRSAALMSLPGRNDGKPDKYGP